MQNALNVSRYLLSLSDEDAGDCISHLKLQKLLYYSQGLHLALYKRPLFREEILAWTHGPVVAEVYQEFKQHGSGPIPCNPDFDFDSIGQETKEFLNEIFDVYGQFSAWKLRDMTHEESPWKETARNFAISHEKLISFFKDRVEDGQA